MLRPQDLPLAEYFPVGEFLSDELEARGWSQAEFAELIGRPTQFVSDIMNNKKEITTASAAQFEAATGIRAQTWLAMQSDYRLWLERQDTNTAAEHAVVRGRSSASEKLF